MADPASEEASSEDRVSGLLSDYQEKMTPLIGVLSRFIVEKEYRAVKNHNNGEMDPDTLDNISRSIIDDLSVLVGPKKAREIGEEIDNINRKYLRKEGKDE